MINYYDISILLIRNTCFLSYFLICNSCILDGQGRISSWGNIHPKCLIQILFISFNIKMKLTSRVFKGRKEITKGQAEGNTCKLEDIWNMCQETEKNLEAGEGRCRPSFEPAGRDTSFFPGGCCPEIRLIIYLYCSFPKPTLTSSYLCPSLPYFRNGSSSI